jgi:hypothetical protein
MSPRRRQNSPRISHLSRSHERDPYKHSGKSRSRERERHRSKSPRRSKQSYEDPKGVSSAPKRMRSLSPKGACKRTQTLHERDTRNQDSSCQEKPTMSSTKTHQDASESKVITKVTKQRKARAWIDPIKEALAEQAAD